MEPKKEGPPKTAADYARLNEPRAWTTEEGPLHKAAKTIKGKARDFAEAKKVESANRIDRLGKAVHEAADELGKELPEAAVFVDSAAKNLHNAADALRDHSVGDLTERLNRFAHRQPLAAFAGAMLAGFVLSRFLKSAPR